MAAGGGLTFQATRYTFTVNGTNRCTDPNAAMVHPGVTLMLTMQPDASGWRAVQEPARGTFVLKLRPGPTIVPPLPTSLSTSLIGSAQGFLDDVDPLLGTFPPGLERKSTGIRITVDGEIPITGIMVTSLTTTGTFEGPVAFSRDGITTRCTPGATVWMLSQGSFF